MLTYRTEAKEVSLVAGRWSRTRLKKNNHFRKGRYEMNYIKELNAFREFLLFTELPSSAISLWYTLMGMNNASRWKRQFNAPNAVVGQLAGLSRQGILDARNILIEHGLISCEQGKKGKAPAYEIHSLAEAADTPLDTSLDPSADQHLNILKHKERQERRQEETAYAHLLEIYEANIGKLPPLMRDEFFRWLDKVGEAVMTEAIKLVVKHGGRTFSYLEKILLEWEAAYIQTPDDIIAYTERKQKPKGNTIPFQKKNKQKSQQSIFDKLREEAEG